MRHATPKRNLESIKAEGIDPGRSKGSRKAVWAHVPGRTPWAILHTQARHTVELDEIVVLEIEIPKSWLTRHQKGLWYCYRPIPWDRVKSVTEATEWAKSPVEEAE